jgi:hypothetical protein
VFLYVFCVVVFFFPDQKQKKTRNKQPRFRASTDQRLATKRKKERKGERKKLIAHLQLAPQTLSSEGERKEKDKT